MQLINSKYTQIKKMFDIDKQDAQQKFSSLQTQKAINLMRDIITDKQLAAIDTNRYGDF